MSLLESISKPQKRALVATIVGEAGTGKSSLAASFPKPIFIRAEDGVNRISRLLETPDAFPPVTTEKQLSDQIRALLTESHDFQTLVVDSVTSLNEMFTAEIIEKSGKENIAQAYGGHGAGYSALTNMHSRVRKHTQYLVDRKGMNVIYIAHADLERMELPDSEDYSRYSILLYHKAKTHYLNNVDLVGYVRLQSALRGEEDSRKRVISNGDREFICYASASSVAKNGLGIDAALDFPEGSNPLAPYLFPVEAEDEKPRRSRRRAPETEIEEDAEW